MGTIKPAAQDPRNLPKPLRPLGKAGRGFWDRVLKAGATWVGGTDLELLQLTAEMQDERDILYRYVKRHPREWRDRLNLRRLDDRLLKSISLLGFSPSDRSRLGLAQVAAEELQDRTEERRDKRQRRGKKYSEVVVEAEVVLEYPDKPRKSWTKGKIVAWYEERELEVQMSLTRKELLAQVGVTS